MILQSTLSQFIPVPKCPKCDFAAVNREELKSHVVAVHRDGDYQCGECDFTAVKRRELKSHVMAVHRDGTYQCDECDFAAVSPSTAVPRMDLLLPTQRKGLMTKIFPMLLQRGKMKLRPLKKSFK